MGSATKAAAGLRKAIRPVLRQGWWHWIRFACLLAAGSWLGHVVGQSDRFSDIRYAMYQKQVRLEHREHIYPQHTALVLLDDDDYWSDEYQGRSPYKRGRLAALLDSLDTAGANIVAFDIDLSSPRPSRPAYDFPDYATGDEALFAAVRRMCDAGRYVVFTRVLNGGPDPPYTPVPALYDGRLASLPCVRTGYDGLPVDMRRIPGLLRLASGGTADSFSLAIVRIADPVAYRSLTQQQDRGFRFGKYLTASDFSAASGRRFLFNGKSVEAMSLPVLRQAIADRIVIVGGAYSSLAYGEGDPVDLHDSPGGPEFGAMLHANYVEAELNQDSTFTPISDRMAALFEWLLALALAVIASLNVPPAWKWGSAAVGLLLSLLLTYALMQNLGLFLDFFVPFLILIGHHATEEILCMRRELRHAHHLLREKTK